MDRIRVLIVDDEPPARAKVRRFLAADPEIEVVGEAGSGVEAVEAVAALAPDLVFLDVQMPGLDGFGVLDALGAGAVPDVVFVTAYDEYAVRAFEVHAVDYLLKPVGPDRFQRALGRAKARVRARRDGADDGLDRRLREVLEQVRARPAYLERLLVPDGARSVLLDVDRIDWIEAERNYVRLHVGAASHLLRGTLAALEARLDPARFIRIHRSHIVNADRVREIHPWSHGDQLVVLRDGTELTLSRRYRDRLSRLSL
ncbi:MAG TPA: LytTR family DNA-binding domain-containing protein [Longimicrobiales bacterium]